MNPSLYPRNTQGDSILAYPFFICSIVWNDLLFQLIFMTSPKCVSLVKCSSGQWFPMACKFDLLIPFPTFSTTNQNWNDSKLGNSRDTRGFRLGCLACRFAARTVGLSLYFPVVFALARWGMPKLA